jgi:hypothetical protein
MEHSDYQVWAICGGLALKKCRGNLRPGRISSHGDKEIASSIESVNGQSILQVLLHIASAASKGGREDISFAQLIHISISISNHCISQAFINLNSKPFLVKLDKVEAILLCNCPGLTDILLKELASKEEMLRLIKHRADE